MKRFASVCLTLILSHCISIAQDKDTISYMHYNLLQYGNYFGGCTVSNNNVADKDGYLKTIIDATLPDIFTVNEMRVNNVYARRIVQNSLNQSGRSNYEQATFSFNGSSDICNMLFYNKDKIGLISQDFIDEGVNNSSLTRRVDVYNLYYKDAFLSSHKDTVKFSVFVCHLNAGNASRRAIEAEAIADYISSNNMKGNYLLGGDLNIDRSTSQAYQNLVLNGDYSLIDPIDQDGSWSSNSSFKAIHTQSTRTSGGCAAGGGMDDRFDFILISNDVKDDSSGVVYIDDSYEAMGQDGLRYNQSLISPPNNTYSSDVISALYEMSDHLPVIVKLAVDKRDLTSLDAPSVSWNHRFQNRHLIISQSKNQAVYLRIYNLNGQVLFYEKKSSTKVDFDYSKLGDKMLLFEFGIESEKPKFVKRFRN